MAEEKGGGGGSGWGALEVVVVLLLVIGLLNRLTNKSVTPISNTGAPLTVEESSTQSSAPEKDSDTCVLKLAKPQPHDTVETTVIISGTTSGCDWRATAEVALYVQVIDKDGGLISEYSAISPSSYNVADGSATFESTIVLSSRPTSGTGYVIVLPAIASSEKSVTLRVPILFN